MRSVEKPTVRHDFYVQECTVTLLMSEIRKLGCKRWIKRYCEQMHMQRRDVVAMLRGVRS